MNSEKSTFTFKQFAVRQTHAAMKVGTDSVVFGAWVDVASDSRVLDVGAGTGVLGLMVAQRNADCQVELIEADNAALLDTRFNVLESVFSNRMTVHGGLFQQMQGGNFDHIICNPPYFPGTPIMAGSRAFARDVKHLNARDLLVHARRLLHENGRLSVILPYSEGGSILDIAPMHGFFVRRQCLMYGDSNSRPIRRMIEFGRTLSEVRQTRLHIRKNGQFSESYRSLTKDFYLGL